MKNKKGFSAIELMIVLAILGLLCCLFIPAINQVRANRGFRDIFGLEPSSSKEYVVVVQSTVDMKLKELGEKVLTARKELEASVKEEGEFLKTQVDTTTDVMKRLSDLNSLNHKIDEAKSRLKAAENVLHGGIYSAKYYGFTVKDFERYVNSRQ